jgi:hypothetical protein
MSETTTFPNFTERYRTRDADRARWGSGPWDDEPDKVVWTDPDTGLAAMIVRGPVGALCGYVGVPETHPWHGVGYSECLIDCGDTWCGHCPDDKLQVHGGVTFADGCAEGDNPSTGICHLDEAGPVWWFGFDCAHCQDLAPSLLRYGVFSTDGTYRDLRYVIAEVRSLAAQLAGVAS